ncbi:MAG: sigma-70 family RNA polymerase sigma factor [Verrucomicrobia bacterium]|nr:sigma-70 family RNA polymerase sigma factor [Verrucomicrobiota bacterium]
MTDDPNSVNELPASSGVLSGDLLPLVYDELRHLASKRMAAMGGGVTLQPTALVHEAWLRLGGDNERCWADRAHFFKTASRAMRGILVDRARRKTSRKRGGGATELSIDEVEVSNAEPEERILMIDEVLNRLETQDPDSARIVTLKFFGGLTNRQIAEMDGVTERTIERQWAYARSCLYEMMMEECP